MKAVVEGIRFAGCAAALPPTRHAYAETPAPFTAAEAAKLHASTGVYERRILAPPWCISDLCLCAAERLLERLGWDPSSVDVLIFVTQNADYVLPATACLMQRRLGLPTTAAAFDLPLGCSGFIYGTWLAGRMLHGSSGRRALLLCGDNSTRWLKPEDRSTLPLFGDAGTATALEVAPEAAPMPLVVGTDGRGGQHLAVKAGGKRQPLIPDRAPWPSETHARLFEDSRLHLNGAEVFGFSLRTVPALVAETLEHAGLGLDAIDWVVLHQANRFMLEHLRKRLKVPAEKFVIDLEKFGNTSSATIPLVFCHALAEALTQGRSRVLMAGFGVGWSWGALVAEIGPLPPPVLVDLPADYPVLTLE